ncbi:MAG TPA: AMP-binding protein [Conexibacter sp.]|jgi:amino acid adenylation domain-containing protein|nr:AMP-binding protein [Conexibacter sp.]
MSALRASPAQEHAWLLEQQLPPSGPSPVVARCLRLDGALDASRVARALEATIGRHPALRSTCVRNDGQLVCRLLPMAELAVATEALPDEEDPGDERALARSQQLCDEPFALDRGPLLRTALLADGARRAYVVLVMHRLVCDEWSTSLLLRDLAAAYAAASDESPTPPPGDPWEHGERARRLVDSRDGERELLYWRERLPDTPATTPLARGSGPPREVRRTLDPALARTFGDHARALGTTRFSICAAALQAALAQLLLDERIRLGVLLADRRSVADEQIVGCLLNPVVLCGRVAADDSFAQLAARAHGAVCEAIAHGRVPFALLAERLGLSTGEDAPLPCQARLEVREPRRAPPALDGLTTRVLDLPAPAVGDEVALTVALDRTAPELRIAWRGELALPADVLLERWRDVLERGLGQPRTPLAVVVPATRAPARSAGPTTVVELLRTRAEGWRERTALVAADAELSFDELLGRADAVAVRLRDAGVTSGVAVGLASERSAAAVVATLAIQAAGGACVPLDPAYPAERLRGMVEDAGVALVLAHDGAAPTAEIGTLALDGRGTARVAPQAPGGAAGAAWIFFTAGSTGRPKAVPVAHATIVARLRREVLAWQADDRGCHKSSPSYGDAIWEVCAPIAHGCACVIADEEAGHDPRLLSRLVERSGVTRMLLVPSLLAALLGLPRRDVRRLAGLRSCIATGEALTGALAERFYQTLPDAVLLNVYGATECWEVGWHVVRRTVRAGDTIPIASRLLEGVTTWIVDEELRPLPIGEPGELVVGGHGVAAGYIGQPALTAERFVPLGALDAHGVGYRTGDVAMQCVDGSFELVGRRDNQVKLRGLRIELEEIERRLIAAPGVAAAAVAPRRDTDGMVVGLTGCLVPRAGAELDAARVRQTLAEQLPEHAIPTAWLQLAELPLGTNGKLDRAALALLVASRAVALDGRGRDAEHAAPRDEVQEILVEIWRDVLGVARVGVTDDFFALGGSSLLAIQIVLRVEEALGVDVPLRELYAQPTIVALSEAIRR